MAAGNKTAILISIQNEWSKSYMIYAVGLQTHIYEAPVDTIHGGPCMLTQYAYDGDGNVIKRKESAAVWDSTWDL